MSIVINPGTGPVPNSSEENARANLLVFCEDVANQHNTTAEWNPDDQILTDDGEGRWSTVILVNGQVVEIDMPGLPLDQVRFTGADDQDIWDFPRLYVEGSSWVWKYAVSVCDPANFFDGEDDS